MKELENVKVFLFDLDGTVYLGGNLIGDVKNTLNKIRAKGVKVGFLTNNSSTTKESYFVKLKNLGVFFDGDFFYSSLDCAADYLLDKNREGKIFALATEKVKEHVKSRGLNVVDDENSANVFLLTFDKELTYEKLVKANRLLGKKDVLYIATHPDSVCPTENGSIPDVGSFTELLSCSSGRRPDVITGKPYGVLAEYIMKKLGVKSDEICMVGDRLYTDIAFGENSGMKTVLVLSGETKEEDLKSSTVSPTLVLPDVNSIQV